MYKAIKDRIIIKIDESGKKRSIVGLKEDYNNIGVVLSVGDMVKTVEAGEKIIFHMYDEIELPQKGLAVVREKSVLAKIL